MEGRGEARSFQSRPAFSSEQAASWIPNADPVLYKWNDFSKMLGKRSLVIMEILIVRDAILLLRLKNRSFSSLAGWLKYSETNLRNLLIYEIEGMKKDTDRNKVFFQTRNIIALLSENAANGKNEKLYS